MLGKAAAKMYDQSTAQTMAAARHKLGEDLAIREHRVSELRRNVRRSTATPSTASDSDDGLIDLDNSDTGSVGAGTSTGSCINNANTLYPGIFPSSASAPPAPRRIHSASALAAAAVGDLELARDVASSTFAFGQVGLWSLIFD